MTTENDTLTEIIDSVESLIDDGAALADASELERLASVLNRLWLAADSRLFAVKNRLVGRCTAAQIMERTSDEHVSAARGVVYE